LRVDVEVTNVSGKPALSRRVVEKMVRAVLRGEAVRRGHLAALFVDRRTIQDLNARFLRRRRPTDVLTFPLSEDASRLEGEIYVCVDVAREQARRYHVSIRQELARLLIHGVLHLLGYDDRTAAQRKIMQAREDRYLEKIVCNLQIFF